jgi:hypothetical protein
MKYNKPKILAKTVVSRESFSSGCYENPQCDGSCRMGK